MDGWQANMVIMPVHPTLGQDSCGLFSLKAWVPEIVLEIRSDTLTLLPKCLACCLLRMGLRTGLSTDGTSGGRMRQQEMMQYLCGVGVSFLPSCPDSFCIERGYICQDSAKNECVNSLILFTRVQNKLTNPFNHFHQQIVLLTVPACSRSSEQHSPSTCRARSLAQKVVRRSPQL